MTLYCQTWQKPSDPPFNRWWGKSGFPESVPAGGQPEWCTRPTERMNAALFSQRHETDRLDEPSCVHGKIANSAGGSNRSAPITKLLCSSPLGKNDAGAVQDAKRFSRRMEKLVLVQPPCDAHHRGRIFGCKGNLQNFKGGWNGEENAGFI